MQMLLDVEDEAAWHTAKTEDEDAGEGNNYKVAQECLDRLAIAIGGNAVVPIAYELLPQFLAAPKWQKHHAALITLAQIAEGCPKAVISQGEYGVPAPGGDCWLQKAGMIPLPYSTAVIGQGEYDVPSPGGNCWLQKAGMIPLPYSTELGVNCVELIPSMSLTCWSTPARRDVVRADLLPLRLSSKDSDDDAGDEGSAVAGP